MFKNPKKFPPGIFIPTPARIVAIIQLCLALCLLLWQLSQPFMGDLFRVKSQLLIYKETMGLVSHVNTNQEDQALLARNAKRFEKLDAYVQRQIRKDYDRVEDRLSQNFGQKLKRLGEIFGSEMSVYQLSWMILSMILPILLLKRVEGASQSIWLLPLLALLFLFQNQRYSKWSHDEEKRLFPTEDVIIATYLKEPLSSDILKQREQLLQGWHLYLIKEWAHADPSKDPVLFQQQIEEGKFNFNVHRLTAITPNSSAFISKSSFLTALLYVIWNLFFASYVNWHLFHEKKLNNKYTPIPAK